MAGQLEKLQIIAYSDAELTSEIEDGTFFTLVNPEKYDLKYKVEFKEQQASGTSAHNLEFDKIPPKEMSFEFLFDRTGAIPGAPADEEAGGVENDITKLKKVVLDYNGDLHRTHYLKIVWGTLLFKCCLTSLDVTYKLFKSDGTPMRAVAKANFKEFKENQLRANEEKTSSPDLTHVRVVKQGDTLPLMTYKIYGSSKYYLAVAKANNLLDFRNLEPGQTIYFPPLDKTNN
ncbi:MAG: LysM peptidoglycan-binding domain-containing protein [Bacteroidota bacterium]